MTGAGTNFNQTASPLFVNLGAGDFHEAAGSPTIDAGTDSPLNGPFDLEGNPREIGSHTDVGAYEFLIPPSTVTSPATSVGPTTATLNGTVDPNGVATTLHFVYGASTAYGSTTATASAGSGTSGSGASATLTGLAPNTTYHYQLLASNSIGESGGGDRDFYDATRHGNRGDTADRDDRDAHRPLGDEHDVCARRGVHAADRQHLQSSRVQASPSVPPPSPSLSTSRPRSRS